MAMSGCGSKESSKNTFEKGTLTDSTYESKFLNIKFTLPEGYTLMTQEMMDQQVEFSNEIVYKDKDKKVIDYAKAVTVNEMMATENTANVPNVNIAIQNLLGEKVSEAEYIESLKKQLTDTGFAYTFDDVKKDVELAGEKFSVLYCSANYNGLELKQECYVRKESGRMMILTVTYTDDTKDAKEALMGSFEAYK